MDTHTAGIYSGVEIFLKSLNANNALDDKVTE